MCLMSGFRVNPRTEPALVRVISESLSWYYLAICTVDYIIFLQRLEHCFSLRGTVLNWLSFYLIATSFSVSTGNFKSDKVDIPYGVPQGSVLGLLFNLYMVQPGSIIQQYNISYQSYVDDPQLYISICISFHQQP